MTAAITVRALQPMVRTQFDTATASRPSRSQLASKGLRTERDVEPEHSRAQQNDGKEHSPMNGNQRGTPLGGLTNNDCGQAFDQHRQTNDI